jgi:hypothetical protein
MNIIAPQDIKANIAGSQHRRSQHSGTADPLPLLLLLCGLDECCQHRACCSHGWQQVCRQADQAGQTQAVREC